MKFSQTPFWGTSIFGNIHIYTADILHIRNPSIWRLIVFNAKFSPNYQDSATQKIIRRSAFWEVQHSEGSPQEIPVFEEIAWSQFCQKLTDSLEIGERQNMGCRGSTKTITTIIPRSLEEHVEREMPPLPQHIIRSMYSCIAYSKSMS